MKILVVTRGYPQKHNNMLGLFEKDQARALLEAGHEVAYAVVDIRSFRKKRKFGYNHYTVDGLSVYEMNYPLGPMPRPLIEFFRSKALIALYKYIVQDFGRPDVVHAHFLNYGVISIELCKSENLPLVVTEHSSYLNTLNLKRSHYKRAMKTYKVAKKVISVSSALAHKLKCTTGVETVVIPNIVDVSCFNADIKCTKEPKKYFEFATAANLLPGKGMNVLIKAFSNVVKDNPDTHLTIYGDGKCKQQLQKLCKQLEISDKVTFYGTYIRKEIAELLPKADAFVLASKRETFGVVYIEAMACGLPVIATKCGGPEDFVDASNGYLVEVDNVEELAEAMKSMIKNVNDFDRKRISNAVKYRFSSEVIASKITQVFQTVVLNEM